MACSPLHHQTRLEAVYVCIPGIHLHLAILLRAREGAHSNALTHFSNEFAKWESPALPPTAVTQKFSCLEPESCVHLLQIPTPKDLHRHILFHSCQFQETRVARGYHTCPLLTAMVHVCRYSPGKPYYSFLHISKFWLKI